MTSDAQSSMSALPKFTGKFYVRGGPEYSEHAYQYATTSQPADHMSPALVVFVADNKDITLAINYARENNLGLAVRSGGHQYIGASSTGGDNIQIDLSGREGPDPYPFKEAKLHANGTVTLGAGLTIDEVNDFCTKHGIFFPHGECCAVHVGGHSQTGGFSVITPTFGAMIDHLVSFHIFLADGHEKVVKADSSDPKDQALWFAVLGGSPGNFGVVTKVTVQPLQDADFPDARCFKEAWFFRAKTLTELVQIINEDIDDPDRDPDLAISVMALGAEYDKETSWDSGLPKTVDEEMQEKHPKLFGADNFHWVVPSIIVCGVWTNSKGSGQSDAKAQAVFKRLKQVEGRLPDSMIDKLWPNEALQDGSKATPMSKILKTLTLENPREFNMSAKKLAWFGKNTQTMSQPWKELGDRTFAEWLGDKVSELESLMGMWHFWGMKAAVQVGLLGGPGLANPPVDPKNPTALAHRDSNYWFAFDVFYDPGVEGTFDKTIEFTNKIVDDVRNNKSNFWDDGKERRLILAPSVVKDEPPGLDDMWRLYYDDKDVYHTLLKTKLEFDEHHVFTPNPFGVGAKNCPRFAP